MAGFGAENLRIEAVPPAGQQRALELLLQPLSADARGREAERLRRSAAAGRLSLVGLLEARRGTETLGVVWAQIQLGRTAVIWMPQTVEKNDPLSERLIQVAVEFAASHSVRLAQALLPARDAPEARWFEAAGMHHLAELDYLVWPASPVPWAEPASGGLSAVPYQEHRDRRRLEKILARTFKQTRDCPALDGIRKMSDVIAGYRSVGASETKYWYLLECAGADAGCLLLSDDEEGDQLEMVYMGLAPEFRGRGLGRTATRRGQQQTCAVGRQRLVLAVDAENAPAQATYAAAGFVRWDRRSALMRVLS